VSLADFTRQFFETALWSSSDESDERGGEPMDKNYGVEDFDPTCRKRLEEECAKFWGQVRDDVKLRWDDERAGHHFWLTRCGHGTGFWDGDYEYEGGEDDGGYLTELSKAFGNVDLYVGDDGKVYASGRESTWS
jgi:hypothetical protein